MDAGGGVEGAPEAFGHGLRRPQGRGDLSHGLHDGGIAPVGPQARPVVVRAVEEGVPGVVRQRAAHVHPVEARQGPRPFQIGPLVKALRPAGQLASPDLRRRGDEGRIDRQVRHLRQTAEAVQVLVRPSGLLHPVDEGVSAQVYAVKLPPAQQVLHPVFQTHPAVPQGELVRQIPLQAGGVAAVRQGGPGEGGQPLQAPVLHRGEVPVRQQHVGQPEARQKQAEHRRGDALCNLCHGILL